MNPISRLNMNMKSKIHVHDKNQNLKKTDLNLEIHEFAVGKILAESARNQLNPHAFLLTFDSREIQQMFSRHNDLKDIDVEQVIGSLWLKTRGFLISNLELQGLKEIETEERYYQLLSSAKMWDAIIYDYSHHTLEECKQLPFFTIFTNRQAQVLIEAMG